MTPNSQGAACLSQVSAHPGESHFPRRHLRSFPPVALRAHSAKAPRGLGEPTHPLLTPPVTLWSTGPGPCGRECVLADAPSRDRPSPAGLSAISHGLLEHGRCKRIRQDKALRLLSQGSPDRPPWT